MNLHQIGAEITAEFRNLAPPKQVNLVANSIDHQIIEFDEKYQFILAQTERMATQLVACRDFLLTQHGQFAGLQVPYPKYFYTSPSIPFNTIGYRKLSGTAFSKSDLALDNVLCMEEFSSKLLRFLRNLQQMQPDFDGIDLSVFPPPVRRIEEYFEHLKTIAADRFHQTDLVKIDQIQKEVIDFFDGYIYEPSLIHGNLTAENLMVEPSTSQLLGVADFTQLRLGDPLVDIASLGSVSSKLSDELFNTYLSTQSLISSDLNFKKYRENINTLLLLEKIYHLDGDSIAENEMFALRNMIATK